MPSLPIRLDNRGQTQFKRIFARPQLQSDFLMTDNSAARLRRQKRIHIVLPGIFAMNDGATIIFDDDPTNRHANAFGKLKLIVKNRQITLAKAAACLPGRIAKRHANTACLAMLTCDLLVKSMKASGACSCTTHYLKRLCGF